jgi:hypothetical protein
MAEGARRRIERRELVMTAELLAVLNAPGLNRSRNV